ncbi:MAG: class I SAM-dependent RNA methyltransferase [Candidatus Krumholzibacteriota bacterium]|nr:class I SAM-dependent RNA methyltransferase [Candidatus Krumholzibacteriota bacterium]
MNNEITATTLFGLEPILAGELESIGAKEIKLLNRAVSFMGDKELLYRANLSLRTCSRLLIPVKSFKVRDEKRLYEIARDIDWKEHLDKNGTLAVDSVVHSKYFTHSKFAALRIKDAVVDQFRDRYGRRPSVDREDPDLRINLHIDADECAISLDSSGAPLHRRGYRLEGSAAPINEVLAAGMVMLAGYDGSRSFIDPLCGSGTIVIEAAMISASIAPGLSRKKFGFQRWKDFDSALYKKIMKELASKVAGKTRRAVVGSDISKGVLKMARNNIERAGLSGLIELRQGGVTDIEPPEGPGILVSNPPYGKRLGAEQIALFYKSIGDTLKSRYEGYEAWIISSNLEALKSVGLRASKKIKLFNGPIECRYQRYDIYSGSKKAKYRTEEGGEGS